MNYLKKKLDLPDFPTRGLPRTTTRILFIFVMAINNPVFKTIVKQYDHKHYTPHMTNILNINTSQTIVFIVTNELVLPR